MPHRPARAACAALLMVLVVAGCRRAATNPVVDAATDAAGDAAQPPGFVGSKSCRDCHEDFYKLWSASFHGLAMQPYSRSFAEAKLTPQPAEIAIGGRKYRAEVAGGKGAVRESGPGAEREYPIVHVLGGKNVYYFLTPLERGRLQVLPLAYDVHKKVWYDAAASGVRHFPDRRDEALDWTDRLFTFNTTCFNCHVSQLATNYDLAADAYHTTWAEPGISCESCHGAAGEHVRLMEASADRPTPKDIKIIRTKEFTAGQMNDMCATCHAKMVPLSLSFRPGEKFFDHFDLVTLEHPDYWPDGRDLGENYTHASWLMSPCIKSGKLDCNHCHSPSGRPRYEGEKANQSCMPCHEKEFRDAAGHSRHPAGSKGTECIPCHMPMTRFAAMGRSDHSMRPPTPAASLAFKSPNACNLCHADHDAAWADGWVRKWYPKDYQAEVVRRGELIDAARKQQWQRLAEMIALLGNGDVDAVRKASLVRLVRSCADERKWPVLLGLLKDPSPLVRSSAATALGDRLTPQTVGALLAAVRDDSRLVRIRAATALAGVLPDTVKDLRDREGLNQAVEEFETAMKARPDDWASHANLGNFDVERREFHLAARHFETAYKLEPRAIGPMVNAAIAYSNLNRSEEAERSLRRALAVEPANAAANFNLGLLLGEQGRLDDAERALRTALKSDPQMAAAAYNLGVVLAKKNQPGEAIAWCDKAHQAQPAEPKYAHALAFFQRQKGDVQAALKTLTAFVERQPLDLETYLLLADVCQKQGDRKAAASAYRQALDKCKLTGPARSRLESRVKSLESP